MKIEIQIAKQEDYKEIAEIYMAEFSAPPYNEPWTFEKATKKIETFSKYCDIWKITEENKILGLLVVNPSFMCPGEVAFGEEIAVKKEFQNKGIGTEALKQAFRVYKEKGFKTFMGIENKTSRAKNLYDRLDIKQSEENILIERRLE